MFRDYKNYEVCEDGRIWSKVRNKWLKPSKDRDGYLKVTLTDNNGKLHYETVHKVVFFAVNGLWEYPEGLQLNHIDEDKTNNHISNLSLVSAKENINWGTRTERQAKSQGKRVGAFKDGELVMVFPSTAEAQRNGYSAGHVCDCCNGKLPHYKGYIWKYLDEQ